MICKQEDVKCIVHCHYAATESSQSLNQASRVEMRKRIEEILLLVISLSLGRYD